MGGEEDKKSLKRNMYEEQSYLARGHHAVGAESRIEKLEEMHQRTYI